jgi:hypothetical protein
MYIFILVHYANQERTTKKGKLVQKQAATGDGV